MSLRLSDFVAERMLLLGAGSTVMYQLARRGVGLGVAEHSTTVARPTDRLRTTLTYVYVTTLGSEVERRDVVRMVNRMHAGVRSPGPRGSSASSRTPSSRRTPPSCCATTAVGCSSASPCRCRA